jgi:hypothetical protein
VPVLQASRAARVSAGIVALRSSRCGADATAVNRRWASEAKALPDQEISRSVSVQVVWLRATSHPVARPTTIATTGSGHHQCSQSAATP